MLESYESLERNGDHMGGTMTRKDLALGTDHDSPPPKVLSPAKQAGAGGTERFSQLKKSLRKIMKSG